MAHRQPRLDRRQERPRHRADRGLPQPRAPDGRHRPAAAGQEPVPQPPRPRRHHARPDAVGPGPGVQGQRLRRRRAQEAARRPRPAARLVLPPRRRRVHPHPGARAAEVARGARRGQAREAHRRAAEVHPVQAQRRRGVRDLPADQIRWAEAVLARRRGNRHPDDGRRDRPGRRARARRGRHRHAAPRPAQRAGQHRRQALLADLQRVRGQPEPVAGARLRRRQVPPRRQRHLPTDVRRQRHCGVAGRQPVTPRGGRPGARGHRPRQAGPAGQGRRTRRVHRRAADAARRRGVRRPGRGRRDAEPGAAARVPHRRHDPHRRQQPDRFHHFAFRREVVGVLHRRREDDRRADLPRQRRRSRGGGVGGAAGDGLPAEVQEGRRHRHAVLPPPRAQRGRRPVDDAARHVRRHRHQARRPQDLHRSADRPRRHLDEGSRRRPARLPGPAGAGVQRGPRAREARDRAQRVGGERPDAARRA